MKNKRLKTILLSLIVLPIVAFVSVFFVGCGGGQAVVTPQIPEETDSSVVLDYNTRGLTNTESRNLLNLFSGELTVGRVDTQVTIKSLPTIETGGLDGWVIKNTNTFVNVGDVIEDGTTLQAKYTEYTVTYNLNVEGATLASPKRKYTVKDSFTLKDPTCEGQIFLGWKINSEDNYTTKVSKLTRGDLVFNANWETEIFLLTDGVITGVSEYGKTLSSLTIPNTVGRNTAITGIGSEAFSECTQLTSLTFATNEQLDDIEETAFDGCTSLEDLTLNITKEEFEEIFGNMFFVNITAHCTDGNIENYGTVITYNLADGTKQYGLRTEEEWWGNVTSVYIPQKGIKTIGDYAFYNCFYLTEVNIPEGITSIGAYAFNSNGRLESINIPSTVEEIGNYAFQACVITEITIPTSVTTIGSHAFWWCENLADITMDVTKEEFYALFANAKVISVTAHCSDGNITNYGTTITAYYSDGRKGYDDGSTSKPNIVAVNIPNGVTNLSYYLRNASNLTSVTLPSTITSIASSSTFVGCTSLETVVFEGETISLGSEIFKGCTSLKNIGPLNLSGLGSSVFANCTSLESITITGSITALGANTFYGCTNLESVTITGSITALGANTFYGCTNLTSVALSENITTIGNYAFARCTSLEQITLPGSIVSMGSTPFDRCDNFKRMYVNSLSAWFNISHTSLATYGSNSGSLSLSFDLYVNGTLLTNLEIPSTIESIADYQFYGIKSITSVTIPSSVTEIGSFVFSGCSGLVDVTIPSSVTEIGSSVFSGCSSLVNITIPSSVTKIGAYAFYACSSLVSITIPESVTIIDHDAFRGCTSLTSISLPNSLTTISNTLFQSCSKLENITIPTGVKTIEHSAFSYCTNLETVIIPDSVTTINRDAFANCTNLKNITMSNNVSSSDNTCFRNCSSVTTVTMNATKQQFVRKFGIYGLNNIAVVHCSDGDIENYGTKIEYTLNDGTKQYGTTTQDVSWADQVVSASMPYGVLTLMSYAFRDCTNLVSVTVSNSVTNVYANAFTGCTSLTTITADLTKEEFILAFKNDYLNNITVHCTDGDIEDYGTIITFNLNDGTKQYGTVVNSSWASNVTSVNVPFGVYYLPNNAFKGCTNLSTISLPNSITSIGNNAFEGSAIINITIPTSVTSLGGSAFQNCTNLLSVTLPNSLKTVNSYTFYGSNNINSITTDFTKEEFMSLFSHANVINISTVHCSDGDISNYGNFIAYNFRDGTTQYGKQASASWTLSDITSVNIPMGVTALEYKALTNCTSLTSITIPSSVKSVDSSSVTGCTGLTSISMDVPKATFIELFKNTAIKQVTLYCSDGTINNYGTEIRFNLNTGAVEYAKVVNSAWINYVATASVSYGVVDLPSDAFKNCSNLTTVTLPDTVTSIGSYAFSNCQKLASITIPLGVTSIGNLAFSNCQKLTTITIPSGVTSIDYNTFSGCTSLTTITIQGNLTAVGTNIFSNCSALTDIYTPNMTREEFISLFNNAAIINATIHCSDGNIDNYGTVITFNLSNGTKRYSTAVNSSWASSVTSANIPYGVESLSANAFYNCTNLSTVVINSSSVSSLLSDEDASYLTYYVTTIYTRSDINTTNNTYLNNNFTQTESDLTGYIKWVRNA